MDNGKVLLVNLAKGRVGEDTSMLLGSLFVIKIYLSALSRTDIPEEIRQDFYLYLDELQSFAAGSYSDMLPEARKYRLCLTLVHQYLDQIDQKTVSAILGNVGTIISFRVSARDAEYLVLSVG